MPVIAKKDLGVSKIATIHIDNSTRTTNQGFFEDGAKLAGVQIVKNVVVPTDATDYTQYVAQIEDSGAQAIVSSMTQQANLALWKALQSAHSSLKTIMSDSAVSQQLVDQAGGAAEGNYTTGSIPAPDSSNEWGKAYLAAMQKYQPQEKVMSAGGLRAYEAVHLFADVAKTIKGDITRKSVFDAFSKVKSMDFAWVKSLSFTKDGPFQTYPRVTATTVFPNVVKSGKLTPTDSFDLTKAGG
jgi:ABC-type branched-subunit amino acid transport system substrate-binding protein